MQYKKKTQEKKTPEHTVRSINYDVGQKMGSPSFYARSHSLNHRNGGGDVGEIGNNLLEQPGIRTILAAGVTLSKAETHNAHILPNHRTCNCYHAHVRRAVLRASYTN